MTTTGLAAEQAAPARVGNPGAIDKSPIDPRFKNRGREKIRRRARFWSGWALCTGVPILSIVIWQQEGHQDRFLERSGQIRGDQRLLRAVAQGLRGVDPRPWGRVGENAALTQDGAKVNWENSSHRTFCKVGEPQFLKVRQDMVNAAYKIGGLKADTDTGIGYTTILDPTTTG
ncbi:hypothetical protein [Mycolicibacterium komossense]|uniref:Uncharacterized protein n=1 Tax=Mycolicibacterium komossense TaxID=1779 RepID=A0ABT3C5R4_9MYCO|nr:hypothetical protein [Mycolicibacterium komossense]MCV7224801.1 hypothetical protein [Mycolicibacterium komossense]